MCCWGDLSDYEVRRRTGIESKSLMMAMIALFTNGDHKLMTETTSSLTWLEEWFLYFEVVWGRTCVRWCDARAIFRSSRMREIFDDKLAVVLKCRRSWPYYVSYEEDKKLRDPKWDLKYADDRVVMWDDTNIVFGFKPSGADEQRITYSLYYNGNCAKGGVFIQLCGWLGVEKLWVGAISDTQYMEFNEIFKKQEEFVKHDLVDNEEEPVKNVMDRGYRCNTMAWRCGRQPVVQPAYASCDEKITGRETLLSGSVAADRSGNERGVKRAKMSGYLRRGLHQTADPRRLDDVWMAWGFQVNFMYDPVL